MNTTYDVLSGSTEVLPCGCRVESVSMGHIHPEPYVPESRSRVSELKSTALERIHEAKRSVSAATTSARHTALEKVDRLRRNTNLGVERVRRSAADRVAGVQASMRDKPMMWAGVAAGAGFGIGLIGRLLDHRRHQHHRLTPQLVVIETGC